jgi:hypothetical protein
VAVVAVIVVAILVGYLAVTRRDIQAPPDRGVGLPDERAINFR